MIVNLTISNTHEKGFAFAVTDEGDQVFIPPHVADGYNLARGTTNVPAQVVTNPNEQQRSNTRWVAVLLHPETAQPEPAQEAKPLSMAELDAQVYDAIISDYFVSTGDIAAALDIEDQRTVGNSAQRLFNAGRISRAEVYNRVGQARPTMILWAEKASDFIAERD